MPRVLLILIGTQVIYSISDFMGRFYMKEYGFRAAAFVTWWFLVYQLIRQVAMFGQLYIFANVKLGEAMALLAATSIVISNILGILLLKEWLSPMAYVGVTLAVIAVFCMAFR